MQKHGEKCQHFKGKGFFLYWEKDKPKMKYCLPDDSCNNLLQRKQPRPHSKDEYVTPSGYWHWLSGLLKVQVNSDCCYGQLPSLVRLRMQYSFQGLCRNCLKLKFLYPSITVQNDTFNSSPPPLQ